MQVGADRQTEKSLWISLKCVGSVFTELTEKVDGEKARRLNKERQEWVYLVSHSHMCWPGRRTEREKPFPCVGQFTPNLPPRESAEKRQLLNSSDTPDTPSHSCLSFFFLFFSFFPQMFNLSLVFLPSGNEWDDKREWRSCTVLCSYIYSNQTRHTWTSHT